MKYNREEELLLVMQEECADVIQAITEIFLSGKTQQSTDNLEKQLSDVFAVFKILVEENYVDPDYIVKEGDKKIEVLNKSMKNKFPKKG
jgi:hypothetical protein